MRWIPALAALGLLACSEASRTAVCDPVGQSGCGSEGSCVVDGDGEPACVRLKSGPLIGDACAAIDECPAGSGCVRVFGLARCTPFCAPDAPDGVGTCYRAGGAGSQEDARCVAALPDRPNIGVCVFPCADPSDPTRPPTESATIGGCPGGPGSEALGCAVPPELNFAVCAPAGEAAAGEPCSADVPCVRGAMCAPRGDGGICRMAVGAAHACEAGELEVALGDSRGYRVCTPCEVVAGVLAGDGPGVVYEICAAEGDRAGAASRCEAEGGALVRFVEEDPRQAVLTQAAADVDGDRLWLGDPGCVAMSLPDGEVGDAPCGAAGNALCRIETATEN